MPIITKPINKQEFRRYLRLYDKQYLANSHFCKYMYGRQVFSFYLKQYVIAVDHDVVTITPIMEAV
jgi:hypothetical protein